MSEEKKPRGFARMTPERRREMASLGGKTAHATGRAHRFSHEDRKRGGHKRAQQVKNGQIPEEASQS